MGKAILGVLLLAGSCLGAGRPRIYLAEHESFEKGATLVTSSHSGATKAEQLKTLSRECPAITLTDDPAKADFFLSWDSKTWQQTSWGGHENEFTIYNSSKDVVGSGAAHHMKNAAKDICRLITKAAAAPPASR
jgi:hypothetical protein